MTGACVMYGQQGAPGFVPSVTSGTGNAVFYNERVDAGKPLDATERETIPRALDSQLQYLAELHKTISVLEERLMLILAPRPPDGNGANTAPAPSSILQRIQLTSGGIGVAGQRIQALIERVQL